VTTVVTQPERKKGILNTMKNNLVTMRILLGTFCLILLSGCTTTGAYNAPLDSERPLTTGFDPDDARRTVEAMVDSMLVFPPVVDMISQRRPVLDVASVQNRTMQTIDTRSLTDSIRTRLIRSGKFRFKDRSTAGDDITIMNEENELGLVDQSQAVKAGQQIATELYLYGAMVEMKARSGRVTDVYYKITMNLKDLTTGEIVWTDEKEIRKGSVRPKFGM